MSDDCETAITETGWGVWHYFIVALCGLLSLAEASTSLTVPIVAPLIACDLKLNRDQATMPIAVSTFGMAVGAFLFGTISDVAGRRKSIPITMGIVFCASATLSFAQINVLINLSVFMLGLGVAGSNIVLRVYLIECLPMRKRGTCLAVIDMFWMVGYLSALGVFWSMMPSVIRMLGKQFRPSSWRILAIICGTPSLVIACTSALLPPSPRYLLHRRRLRQALVVLQQMYAINNSKHADTYPIRDLEDYVRPDDEDESGSIQRYFTKTWERMHRIYRPPYKRVTLCGMLACLLHFPGFVWLALWNTHVLQEMEKAHVINGNGTCNINVQNMALDFLRSCDEVNESRFELLLLVSFGYVLGEALLIFGIDVVGRRPCLSNIFGTGGWHGLAYAYFSFAPRDSCNSVVDFPGRLRYRAHDDLRFAAGKLSHRSERHGDGFDEDTSPLDGFRLATLPEDDLPAKYNRRVGQLDGCGDCDATSARFNRITDEGIVYTSEFLELRLHSPEIKFYFTRIPLYFAKVY